VPDYNVQVAPLGKYILDQHHHKTALLYSSSTYFEGLANAIRDYMKAAGTPLAEVINLNPKEMSLNSVLARLQKSGVDSLIIFLQEGGDVPNLFRQARTLKYKPQIYSYDLAYDDVLVKDWHLADDAVFFAYTGKFDRGLYERYKARFNSEPPWTVPKAYDNVFILKEAIEKCGDAPTAIRDCLSKTDYHGTSGHIRYSESGNIIGVEKITELRKVVDGKVIPLP
jgi:ABC-type branched-subunit amino acid transport system substrate-binding protein